MAYNVVFLASVSTVLFNGNPLLRYDGYYMLSDWVEIPNLYQRGLEYVGYLFQRHVFGVKHLQPPYAAPGERFWFVAYTVTSFVYRAFLYVEIILFIAGKFFIAGVLLAVWAGISMIGYPAVKRIRFVATSPVLRNNRVRAVLATAGILAAVLLLLFVMPFRHPAPCFRIYHHPHCGTQRQQSMKAFVSRRPVASAAHDRFELS